jgi:hypothetical protein
MDRPLPDDVRQSKKLPIVIKWGSKRIYLGEIEFLKDGSLVFESSLHSSKDVGATVEFGTSNFKDGQFSNVAPDTSIPIGTGFHISLHPAVKDKSGAMHFRKHYPGKVLYRREIKWFPVKVPFNLLHVYTLPLDMCPTSLKQPTVITVIDPRYNDSLEMVVDVFPRDTETHRPIVGSAEVWGFCPDYLVRVSLMLAKQRTPALVYWPVDDKLEL